MKSVFLILAGVILGNFEGGIPLSLETPEWNSSCKVRTDSTILWAVGESGQVANYVVGNDSVPILIEALSLGEQYRLNDVFFWDELNGWIVGQVNDHTEDQGKGVIWRTVNGGQDWIPYPAEHLPYQIFADRLSFSGVTFYSPYIGFIECSTGYLLKTIDGGMAWSLSKKTQTNSPQVE